MFHRIRPGLTFANVCSLLALMIALGTGTAYAAGTVFSSDIVNGQVKTVDLAGKAVATGKIVGGAVTGGKVKDGTLKASDLATDSVGMVWVAPRDGRVVGRYVRHYNDERNWRLRPRTTRRSPRHPPRRFVVATCWAA